ncbi:Uncharacterized protein OS=Candidatus Entotheonella sp. TSY1 GN=ETSY1_13155 PE=4 SV=1 [Gemmataceae bacterium]|jgi:hypothetical protein|nr:Uncharacterized protein OS=Candidatus Entotheonella sp. TSY1 GN=ETSY1_13155 PE=4 SV=1 [Gemmataceae bacterium]VTU01504.1 Uncharacterized protein OS=Candidatus Entotheonella sp. TSY1 GN=ETSY1_13155 PE=4 SV=1 [Gemmataceae bacterium]
MSLPDVVLLANAAATWFMCGVIWFVQLVHYPLFRAYDPAAFGATMLAHQAATQKIVFPAMMVELVTALALLAWPPAGAPVWVPWLGAALVGVGGFATVLVMVPLHERLAGDGFDEALHRRLVRWNWVRTAAWSARGAVCAAMIALRQP